MNKTNISWTDFTWNPVIGCSPVSPACAKCYAAQTAHQKKNHPNLKIKRDYGGLTNDTGHWSGIVRPLPGRLNQPLRRRKPSVIFVCSMSDLFHRDVPEAFIKQVFCVIEEAGQHTFMVLTKRSSRLAEMAPRLPWRRNLWAGVTVENSSYVNRIDDLRRVPVHGNNRFLSGEPLLGPMPDLDLRGIGLVIVGGEAGRQARPMDISWARSIRDQCSEAQVMFHFKQWGGHYTKAGGRELDGRIHDARLGVPS